MMKNFRGHRRCTHELYPSIVAGRMADMIIQKKRREGKSSSSNDVVRNGFPNRSVRRGKQEGVKDALVE
jgi:hypothetical protein